MKKLFNKLCEYALFKMFLSILLGLCGAYILVGLMRLNEKRIQEINQGKQLIALEYMKKNNCIRIGFVSDRSGPKPFYSCNKGEALLYIEIENEAIASRQRLTTASVIHP